MFKIVLSPKAAKQIKSLERYVQLRIKVAMERNLLVFPPLGDVRKMEGRENRFRLRVGDWRIIFRYQFANLEVHIAEVAHRSKIYRG